MKLQRKPKAAVLFCKLFDSRAFTCICLLTRIDHVHPLEIKLYVQILSGMVSKFKYFRFLEFIMTLSGE